MKTRSIWTPDGRFGVIEAQSYDNKDRWLLTFNPEDGSVKLLDRQRDEAWIAAPAFTATWAAKTFRIMLTELNTWWRTAVSIPNGSVCTVVHTAGS